MTSDESTNGKKYIFDLAQCPSCAGDWRYQVNDHTELRLLIIHAPGSSRILGWECPFCHATWKRNDKEGDEPSHVQ